jgi:hypothetical protein
MPPRRNVAKRAVSFRNVPVLSKTFRAYSLGARKTKVFAVGKTHSSRICKTYAVPSETESQGEHEIDAMNCFIRTYVKPVASPERSCPSFPLMADLALRLRSGPCRGKPFHCDLLRTCQMLGGPCAGAWGLRRLARAAARSRTSRSRRAPRPLGPCRWRRGQGRPL